MASIACLSDGLPQERFYLLGACFTRRAQELGLALVDDQGREMQSIDLPECFLVQVVVRIKYDQTREVRGSEEVGYDWPLPL